MKKIRGSIIGIAVFLVLLSAVSAVDATTVKVEPASQTVASGQPFSVNITVEDVTNMSGDQAYLWFNPAAMQVTAITEGDFLPSVSSTAWTPQVSNAEGWVKVMDCYWPATDPITGITYNVSGSGTLAKIVFSTNASAEGAFDLNLTDVLLRDLDNNEITTGVINGTVSLDKTPPTMTVLTPIEGKNYSSICVKLNVLVQDDESGIDCMWYNLDGGDNVTIFDNGNHGTVVYGEATIFDDLDKAPYEHSIVVYVNNTVGKENYVGISFTVHPGDIIDDGIVNLDDLIRLADAAFSEPGDDNWDEDANLNCDSIINLDDLMILADNAFKEYSEPT